MPDSEPISQQVKERKPEMKYRSKKYNLNDIVEFRLTEEGRNFLAAGSPVYLSELNPDEDGLCESSLWEFANHLGPGMHNGGSPLVEGNAVWVRHRSHEERTEEVSGARRKFRAGDEVRHRPTGETWVLACDEDRGDVHPSGWPETVGKARDCELVKASTDAERKGILRSHGNPRFDDTRARLARQQLKEGRDTGGQTNEAIKDLPSGGVKYVAHEEAIKRLLPPDLSLSLKTVSQINPSPAGGFTVVWALGLKNRGSGKVEASFVLPEGREAQMDIVSRWLSRRGGDTEGEGQTAAEMMVKKGDVVTAEVGGSTLTETVVVVEIGGEGPPVSGPRRRPEKVIEDWDAVGWRELEPGEVLTPDDYIERVFWGGEKVWVATCRAGKPNRGKKGTYRRVIKTTPDKKGGPVPNYPAHERDLQAVTPPGVICRFMASWKPTSPYSSLGKEAAWTILLCEPGGKLLKSLILPPSREDQIRAVVCWEESRRLTRYVNVEDLTEEDAERELNKERGRWYWEKCLGCDSYTFQRLNSARFNPNSPDPLACQRCGCAESERAEPVSDLLSYPEGREPLKREAKQV